MKARGIKGVRMGAPVRLQKAVPRSKENAAVERREARRSALWAGNSRPAGGSRPCRKAGQWVRRSAPANFGAPLPSYWECEGFETDNLARQSAGMRRAATLPHGSTMHGERNNDAEICAPASPPSCAGLTRASMRRRNDESLTLLLMARSWMAGSSPAMTNDGFWRNEPERPVLAERTRDQFWRNEPEAAGLP